MLSDFLPDKNNQMGSSHSVSLIGSLAETSMDGRPGLVVTASAIRKYRDSGSLSKSDENNLAQCSTISDRNLDEYERFAQEKAAIDLLYQRQLERYQEQNEHLKEQLESPNYIYDNDKRQRIHPNAKRSDHINPVLQQVTQGLEACLLDNLRQPLKCSNHVYNYLKMTATT